MKFLGNLTIRGKFLLVPLVAAGGMLLLGALFFNVLNTQQALLSRITNQELVKIDDLSRLLSELTTNHVQIFDLQLRFGFDGIPRHEGECPPARQFDAQPGPKGEIGAGSEAGRAGPEGKPPEEW